MITDSEYYASLLRRMRRRLSDWHPETVGEKAMFLDAILKKEPMIMMALFLVGLVQTDLFKQAGIKVPPMSGGIKELWDMLMEPGVFSELKRLLKERGIDVG